MANTQCKASKSVSFQFQLFICVLSALAVNCAVLSNQLEFSQHGGATIREQPKDYAPCVLCKFTVQKLLEFLEGETLPNFIGALYKDCMHYIDIPNICQGLCTDVSNLLEKLPALLGGDICEESGFCPTGGDEERLVAKMTQQMALETLKKNDSILCEVCKKIVHTVDTPIFEILNRVVNEVETFCERLTPPTDQECKKELSNPLQEKVNEIEKRLNETTVCSKDIDVCSTDALYGM